MYDSNHLAHRLRQGSSGRENSPFLIDAVTGGLTSYGDFFSNAERMARALRELGVLPGDRVAVQAPKSRAMLELYVGCVLAGAVFLPLNTAYMPAEIGYFLRDAEPRLLICAPEAESLLAAPAGAAGVAHTLTLADDETGTLTDARDSQPAGFTAAPRGAEDLAAILYTSGTTGRSKGAMLAHRALSSNAEALMQCWRFTRDDILIHALPIFHSHGLFVATNVALLSGCACIFMPRFETEAVLRAMPRATALMGVPTFYTRLLTQPGLAEAASEMRVFISGSAPLLSETHDRWREVTGHAILERYGMTETNMNTSNPYEGDRRAGTVGFPLPGVEVKICDPESGQELERGDVGMIELRGPNLFTGYWRMPEKTAEEVRANGFFITGDLGRVDQDGYLHIVGRSKDLIISGGFNIYPKEVELLIDALPAVTESAVIGVPHPDLGEAVVAVVVPAPGSGPGGDEVIRGIAGTLARFKQPRQVVFVDELPRNTMGKVQKNRLRETFAGLFQDAG